MTQQLAINWKGILRDMGLGAAALGSFYLMVLLPFQLGWQFNMVPLLGSVLWAQVWIPRLKRGIFAAATSVSGQLVVLSLLMVVMVPALWCVWVFGK